LPRKHLAEKPLKGTRRNDRCSAKSAMPALRPVPRCRRHPGGARERRSRTGNAKLTYVKSMIKVTHMEKTQVYLRKEELDALRKMAAQSGRSVAELVRDAIRKVVLKLPAAGPVAIWDGEPNRASVDHDSVHDEP
jgi:Ribbon-helix-helix protein, copG family